MNIQKKTIFLTNSDKNKSMACLTLENKNNNIFGTIKTYNTIPQGEYVLGIKHNNKVIKHNIKLDGQSYNFILSEKISLDNPMGCVILKVNNNDITTILWGSDKSDNYKSSIIATLRNSISKLNKAHQLNKNTFEKNYTYNKQSQSQHCENLKTYNHNILNQNSQSNTTQNTKEYITPHAHIYQEDNDNNQQENIILHNTQSPYTPHHQYDLKNNSSINNNNDYDNNFEDVISPFRQDNKVNNFTNFNIENYSQISLDEELITRQKNEEIAMAQSTAQLFESDNEEVENLIDNELKYIKKSEHKFYDMISDQIEELFNQYPPENNLCKLIENSKWVKINTGIDNIFHVVGIIYSNNDIKYICYGVPGSYNNEPPIEMRKYSQWLPVDTNDPYNNGYWVMYQDADTGENIIID